MTARDGIESLSVRHEIEVHVGLDFEDLIDLVEHLTMLSSDDDDRF